MTEQQVRFSTIGPAGGRETGATRMALQVCAFRDELLATDLERAAAEVDR